MTEHEIKELRERLAAEARRFASHKDYITGDWIRVTPLDRKSVV